NPCHAHHPALGKNEILLIRTALLLACVLALASCTTTEQANEALAARFVGAPVDEFFIQHGPPSASHTLDDGRRMYLWAEKAETVTFGGVSNAQVTMVGNTAWVTGWSTPPN